MFALPPLPYAATALEPVISSRTLSFHHGKHHAAYVAALNALLETAPHAAKAHETLEAIIVGASKAAEPKLFNNAAQAWNHSFFWLSMGPAGGEPSGALAAAIDRDFGDTAALKAAFVTEGVGHFGSGWVWLAADANGALKVISTHDADDTLTKSGLTPLLVCDLWEHAYYLDHQNNRKGFLEAWFDTLANWTFAARQYAAATGAGEPWRHPAPAFETAPA